MARYDIETYIDDFIAKLKTELNTRITAINNDKGDSLLSTISNEAYYYKKTNPSTKASKQFVYYEPYEEVSIDDSGSMKGFASPAKTYPFEMGIAFRNNNRYSDDDLTNHKMVMRYQKAFEEALVCVNGKLTGYGQLTLQSIQSSEEERNEQLLHVSGFNVQVTLGG